MEILNLLVADDEPGMRSAIRRALTNYRIQAVHNDPAIEFAIDEADSGEAALQKIKTDAVDILLLDYKLPQMSGLDLLDRIADMKAELTTIMITAYASIETAVQATRKGAYDFLAKPFTPNELKSALYRAARVRMLQRKAHRLVQEKKRYRLELLSIVSHELKRPLAAVETYLNILQNRSAGEDPKAYADMIERCRIRTRDMRKLIVDLLDSARIDSDRRSRKVELLDLIPLLKSVLDTLSENAVRNQIAIHLTTSGRLEFPGDRHEMEMIFSNLLSNAIKYNRPQGSVDVDLTRLGQSIVLRVADTGIGIAPTDMANIFNEFARVNNEKTRDIPGSGLGLSIVKKLVALYGGDISVESVPERGTTFTVTLNGKPA